MKKPCIFGKTARAFTKLYSALKLENARRFATLAVDVIGLGKA